MSENHFEQARQWLRARNVQRLTWGDVDAFICERELDRDEYFESHTVFRHHHANWQSEVIYAGHTRWVAVYWVVGASEGYYVRIETRECETQKAELAFLGKF